MKKTAHIALVTAAALVYAAALIYYSDEVLESAVNSVRVCLVTIIPSLYAFMVISGFIISSGIYRYISRPFGAIARYIFRIPADFFSIFLLSSAAGYPVGAKLTSDLYLSGRSDRETAERMLGFCYMGGPAFFCGVAGGKIYSSTRTGIFIFICILISNIITGFILGLKHKVPPKARAEATAPDISLCKLTESISSGGASILKICGAIVFFSSLTAILEASGLIMYPAAALSKISGVSYDDCLCIIKAILEISNIGGLSPDISLLPTVTALLSFGGLCVIFQTQGIIGNKLSTNIFYLGRIISIFLSYFCCKIFINIFSEENVVQTNLTYSVGYSQISPIPSVFLLIMTILLLSNNYIAKSKKI